MAIRYLYDEQAEMREWAEDVSPYSQIFSADAWFIGIAGDGGIRAVVVFQCFSDVDCIMHIVSDGSKRWCTREFLTRVFAYPFVQRGQLRVTGTVPACNEAAIRMNLKLGFRIEGRARQGFSQTEDMLYIGMTRDECNFIGRG